MVVRANVRSRPMNRCNRRARWRCAPGSTTRLCVRRGSVGQSGSAGSARLQGRYWTVARRRRQLAGPFLIAGAASLGAAIAVFALKRFVLDRHPSAPVESSTAPASGDLLRRTG